MLVYEWFNRIALIVACKVPYIVFLPSTASQTTARSRYEVGDILVYDGGIDANQQRLGGKGNRGAAWRHFPHFLGRSDIGVSVVLYHSTMVTVSIYFI